MTNELRPNVITAAKQHQQRIRCMVINSPDIKNPKCHSISINFHLYHKHITMCTLHTITIAFNNGLQPITNRTMIIQPTVDHMLAKQCQWRPITSQPVNRNSFAAVPRQLNNTIDFRVEVFYFQTAHSQHPPTVTLTHCIIDQTMYSIEIYHCRHHCNRLSKIVRIITTITVYLCVVVRTIEVNWLFNLLIIRTPDPIIRCRYRSYNRKVILIL